MKRTILFLVCLMGMTFAFAQGNMQDVVYLKNGSIIRGEIIEMVSGETVKIMTVDGCLFVWDMDEVERITQEEMRNRGEVQEEKFVFLSGLLSFMVPGVGQYYIGERHDGKIDLIGVLVKAGLNPSRSEARRAVEQGGVTVDGEKVTDLNAIIDETYLTNNTYLIIKKRRFKSSL